MLRPRRTSLTFARPRRTFVSVPSQRSSICHTLASTVAELFRALIRKRPLALARRRRIVRRPPAAPARVPLHARKLGPIVVSSVSPLALRFFDWLTRNSDPEKVPLWRRPALAVALTTRTLPLRESTRDPTGILRGAATTRALGY